MGLLPWGILGLVLAHWWMELCPWGVWLQSPGGIRAGVGILVGTLVLVTAGCGVHDVLKLVLAYWRVGLVPGAAG